jgi:hypothetical protein
MEDELRLHARAAAAIADEAAYLRARLADADDGMCSFASEPHGAPLPARAVVARRVTRTPQIGHDLALWKRSWRACGVSQEREEILHLKGQAEQQCNAYHTRRGALERQADGFLAHIKHARCL